MSGVIVEGFGNLLYVKYHYAGATRAAIYLGVTFLGDAPLRWSHSGGVFWKGSGAVAKRDRIKPRRAFTLPPAPSEIAAQEEFWLAQVLGRNRENVGGHAAFRGLPS